MKSLAKVKRLVSQFIRENPNASYDKWVEFQKEVPEVRIRRATDSITQINLEGNKSFIDPSSWLNNYIAGQKIKLSESIESSCKVLSPEEISDVLWDLDDSVLTKEPFSDIVKWDRLMGGLLKSVNDGDQNSVHKAMEFANELCSFVYGGAFKGDEGIRKLYEESVR